MWILLYLILFSFPFWNSAVANSSLQENLELLQVYRNQYQTIKKRLVKKVEAKGIVTPEENAEMHKFKRLARETAKAIEIYKGIKGILKENHRSPLQKRIQPIKGPTMIHSASQHVGEIPGSVEWTEVIDVPTLKMAVLSFRILRDPLKGLWMDEALSKAYPDYGDHQNNDNNSGNTACRTTVLVVSTTGQAVDNQHAKASPLLVPPYSQLTLIDGSDSDSGSSSSRSIIGRCTLLTTEGYSQIICAMSQPSQCDKLYEYGGTLIISHYLHLDLNVLPISTLMFHVTRMKKRDEIVNKYLHMSSQGDSQGDEKKDKKDRKETGNARGKKKKINSAVVSHLGTRSQSTILSLEAWLRYHATRQMTTIIFDR
jgi:hypothetical protein